MRRIWIVSGVSSAIAFLILVLTTSSNVSPDDVARVSIPNPTEVIVRPYVDLQPDVEVEHPSGWDPRSQWVPDEHSCVYQLPPPIELACRGLQQRSVGDWNASWCPALSRCVVSASGTYAASPQWRQPPGSGATPLQELLFYGTAGMVLHRELEWLPQRFAVHKADWALQQAAESSRALPYPKRLNVAPAFRGNSVISETAVEDLMNRLPSSMDHFSSHLYRLVPTGKVPLVVFCGDSTLRELFFRLVHHFRHGRSRPYFDVPTWGDVLYVLHKGHGDGASRQPLWRDAVHFFDSPSSRKHPSSHLLRGLDALLSAAGGPSSHTVAVAFLFTKRTKQPRKEVWGDSLGDTLWASTVTHVAAVVEGTLFWEKQRYPKYMKKWSQLALQTQKLQDATFGAVLILLTGHFLFEACRRNDCRTLIPVRQLGGSTGVASTVPDADIAQIFNWQKNVELWNWVQEIDSRRREVDVNSASRRIRRVAVLDKARVTLIPAILPTDHIHLACRVMPFGRVDPVTGKASSLEALWNAVLSKGASLPTPSRHSNLIHVVDTVCGENASSRCQFAPQRDQWMSAERYPEAEKNNRYVSLTTDYCGCHDHGNALLLAALFRGLTHQDENSSY